MVPLLPFAGTAFHRDATELADNTQSTAVGTCFDTGFRARIAADLTEGYRLVSDLKSRRITNKKTTKYLFAPALITSP